MRTLFLAEGPALTDQQFTQSAIDAPLSALTTAGYAARSAVEQTLLGTVARVAKVPAPAKKNVMTSRFSSTEVVDAPDVVAARGDKLYSTAEEYKASPYYREAVPFDTGMTESRARALAELNDEKAIRDFYAAKRPVAALVGGFGGSAIAPENYIPILNEYSGAATTSRMGKLAWTALRGGADAALNSAAFQTLTAPTRAKFGDDVSWQAIGENAAFAAAAGAVIGGLKGGYEALRDRYNGSKFAPDSNGISAPNATSAPSPDAAMGAPQTGDIQPSGPAPDTFSYTLNGGGRPTGRMEPVWSVAPPDPINGLLDRVETPAARARAAVVMNDAVSGLALDGEVRLGEQAKANIAQMRADIESAQIKQAWEKVRSQPTGPVDDPLVQITPQDIEGSILSRGAFKDINEVEFSRRGYGLVKIIWGHGPESRTPVEYQIRQSDLTAFPDVIRTHEPSSVSIDGKKREWRVELAGEDGKLRQVVFADTLMGDGNRHVVTAYIPEPGKDPNIAQLSKRKIPAAAGSAPQAGNLVGDTNSGPFDRSPEGQPLPASTDIASEGPIAKTATSFAVPAPEPMLPQLTAAYKATDELPKVVGSLDADIRRGVLLAKAEGLDLETGAHDLETDMTILKELGSLTPEEETALAAADDTFTAAEAWEEVTSNLITCRATNA